MDTNKLVMGSLVLGTLLLSSLAHASSGSRPTESESPEVYVEAESEEQVKSKFNFSKLDIAKARHDQAKGKFSEGLFGIEQMTVEEIELEEYLHILHDVQIEVCWEHNSQNRTEDLALLAPYLEDAEDDFKAYMAKLAYTATHSENGEAAIVSIHGQMTAQMKAHMG